MRRRRIVSGKSRKLLARSSKPSPAYSSENGSSRGRFSLSTAGSPYRQTFSLWLNTTGSHPSPPGANSSATFSGSQTDCNTISLTKASSVRSKRRLQRFLELSEIRILPGNQKPWYICIGGKYGNGINRKNPEGCSWMG